MKLKYCHVLKTFVIFVYKAQNKKGSNMVRIALGTTNPHKLAEINEIIKEADISGIEFMLVQDKFEPEENGTTFEENSYIKAKEAARIMNMPALADDTGLCVNVLGGRPGLYSARYAPTQKEKISKLLNEMKNIPKEQRQAYFICTMTLVAPNGEKLHTQIGKINGLIEEKPSGENGFGYDPIFYIPHLNKTMADMTLKEKNTLSHRALALIPMLEWINKHLNK